MEKKLLMMKRRSFEEFDHVTLSRRRSHYLRLSSYMLSTQTTTATAGGASCMSSLVTSTRRPRGVHAVLRALSSFSSSVVNYVYFGQKKQKTMYNL